MARNPYHSPMQRPGNVGALLASAAQFLQGGMAGQAKAQCEQALKLAPGNAQAHYLLGLIAVRANRLDDAAGHLGTSLAAQPENPAGRNNLGVVFKKLGRLREAAEQFALAVALRPDYADAHHNLGNTRRALGELDGALSSFVTVAQLKPDASDAFNNQADILLALDRPAQALPLCEKALALNPANAKAHTNHGSILARLRRFEDALAAFARAISLDPADPLPRANRGAALMALRRHEEAMEDLDQALALDPDQADALENRANAAAAAKRPGEAAAFYARLLALAPDHPFAPGNLLHAKMLAGDWDGIEALSASIREGLAQGRRVAEPFGYQGISRSEADLLACARIFAEAEFPAVDAPAPRAEPAPDGRITIGYLCGEFRRHATTILMCGVYEAHDKERFRLVAFDNAGGDESPERRRVEAAFDEIVDISRLSCEEAAALVRERRVDILVNLNGYFGEGRMDVFARKPAAVQVNYLGFPGTFGAPYIDYLVADSVTVPPASHPFYTEKIVTLPHSYQANDDRREIGDPAAGRAGAGLPPDGFVFCCFNNNYKITPETFGVWMRILQRVPGSCLWLLHENDAVVTKLRDAALARGIDPQRLVFARRLPPDEHLARHALADLFLDTWPYNAHTTASDALWAGLPLLTRTGETFPGRVATSLLLALDLPELATADDAAYEAAAVELALQPDRLAAVRGRLRQARTAQPLFDTARFTRHLEEAYRRMAERARAGLPPEHFAVPREPQGRNS